MTDLAKLTSPQARAFFHARTIAILPCGATEPHGPHLPLDTDVTIAVAQARRAAEKLEALGAQALVLPPIAYGITNWTQGFAGRISIRTGTLFALIEDLLSALEFEGIRQLVVVNAHLEPDNVRTLRNALLDRGERRQDYVHAVFADNTRRKFAEKLGEEFQSGDCHAGSYETSLVLAAEPESVRDFHALPKVRIDLIEKAKAGVESFREAGAKDAYCGDPAAASAEEGRALYETLADEVVTLARASWPELFEGRGTA
ncbi:MAG: creatininase family protein [Planctomycetes bacterium]|nr:creatininase family protein [Planctomycetota bacterium]